MSDKFGLNGVFYAIALFLGAVGLVFKTKIRWGFSAIGWLGLAGPMAYTFSLPFA